MVGLRRNCELCDDKAAVYCASDSAHLCWTCDAKVHNANFLVARHIRSVICSKCRNLADFRLSGAGISPSARNLCKSCSPEDFEDDRRIRSKCADYRVSGTGMSPAAKNLCKSCSPENFDDDRCNRSIISFVCSKCQNLAGNSPSGMNLFRSCSPEEVVDDDDDSLSSSSSCVSSTTEERETTSLRRKRKRVVGGGVRVAVDLKVEGVLVNWSRRMSIDDDKLQQVVTTAVEVLSGGCLGKMTVLPFRVSLATSFWVAMRVCCRVGGGSDTWRDLRRLEQISGVPGKLILATEARLARVVKRRQSREDHEEGWAEC